MPKQYAKRRIGVFFRLPESLLVKLQKEAREERRAISAQLVVVLEDRYGRDEEVMEVVG
jgi:hypothetical protein